VAAGALDLSPVMFRHAQDNRENLLALLTEILVGRHGLLLENGIIKIISWFGGVAR
jgi:hypothetical protein